MTKSLTKVIYKPDSQSTDEYLMFVNHEEVRRGSFVSQSEYYLKEVCLFYSTGSGKQETSDYHLKKALRSHEYN